MKKCSDSGLHVKDDKLQSNLMIQVTCMNIYLHLKEANCFGASAYKGIYFTPLMLSFIPLYT